MPDTQAKDVAQMWYNVFKEKSSIKKVTLAVIDDHRNSAAQDFKNLLIKSWETLFYFSFSKLLIAVSAKA